VATAVQSSERRTRVRYLMFGNSAGIVTPIVIGYLLAATGSFDAALIFVGAHCLLAIFAYFVVAGRIRLLDFSK